MDEDRIQGVGHQIKGTLKEVAGTVTGNDDQKSEGTVERVGGKLQGGVGKGRDVMRDLLKV